MQTSLLKRAREGRIAALQSLGELEEHNIFLLGTDPRRAPNKVQRVQFTSARRAAAKTPAAPDLRIAA